MNKLSKTEVYLRAAKSLSNKDGSSCLVVDYIEGNSSRSSWGPASELYRYVMSESGSQSDRVGWVQFEEAGVPIQDLRVLTLCMMAACHKDF